MADLGDLHVVGEDSYPHISMFCSNHALNQYKQYNDPSFSPYNPSIFEEIPPYYGSVPKHLPWPDIQYGDSKLRCIRSALSGRF